MRLYELALNRLNDEEYKAIVLRVEHEFTYEQLAEALEKPSWNAARMSVARAMLKLSKLMRDFAKAKKKS